MTHHHHHESDHPHDHHHDHHDHHHGHSHPHGHCDSDHGHEHAHHSGAESAAGGLSMAEKMVRLLEHWKQHNGEHARSYREWAERAGQAGMADVAAALEKAARMTSDINEALDAALSTISVRV